MGLGSAGLAPLLQSPNWLCNCRGRRGCTRGAQTLVSAGSVRPRVVGECSAILRLAAEAAPASGLQQTHGSSLHGSAALDTWHMNCSRHLALHCLYSTWHYTLYFFMVTWEAAKLQSCMTVWHVITVFKEDTWHIHKGMSKCHMTAWMAKCMALGHMTHIALYWLHPYTMTFIMFSYNLSTFFIAILPLPSTTILFAILMFFAEIIAICKKFEVFTVEIPKLFDQIEKVSKNINFSIESNFQITSKY